MAPVCHSANKHRSALYGSNLFPVVANSFLLEQIVFRKAAKRVFKGFLVLEHHFVNLHESSHQTLLTAKRILCIASSENDVLGAIDTIESGPAHNITAHTIRPFPAGT